MKKIIFILCSLFIAIQVQSQIVVKYSVGYGSYDMSGMNDYIEDARSSILKMIPNLNIVTTDEFPSYITHTVNIGYKIQNHELGLISSYLNTAGKFSYSDYSGKISSEMRIKGYRTGLYYKCNFYEIGLKKERKISFFGELSPSLYFSKIKLKNEIMPENNILNGENLNLNKVSLSILPQIGVQYDITSHIVVFCSGGYDINIGSKIEELNNQKVDWSGFRLNGGIGYYF